MFVSPAKPGSTCATTDELEEGPGFRAGGNSGSVQRHGVVDMTEAGRPETGALLHIHGMQLTLDVGAPEFEKAPQFGIVGCKIEFLPDEALEQGRMIRQAIDDLSGGEPVPPKLQFIGAHVGLFSSLLGTEVTSMIVGLLRSNKKS